MLLLMTEDKAGNKVNFGSHKDLETYMRLEGVGELYVTGKYFDATLPRVLLTYADVKNLSERE